MGSASKQLLFSKDIAKKVFKGKLTLIRLTLLKFNGYSIVIIFVKFQSVSSTRMRISQKRIMAPQ